MGVQAIAADGVWRCGVAPRRLERSSGSGDRGDGWADPERRQAAVGDRHHGSERRRWRWSGRRRWCRRRRRRVRLQWRRWRTQRRGRGVGLRLRPALQVATATRGGGGQSELEVKQRIVRGAEGHERGPEKHRGKLGLGKGGAAIRPPGLRRGSAGSRKWPRTGVKLRWPPRTHPSGKG